MGGSPPSMQVRALGALVLLQALTASPEGQALLLQHCPELLRAVCVLACSDDDEAEGLRHASLRLLGGWHDESQLQHGGGGHIARWLATERAGPASRAAGGGEVGGGGSHSILALGISATGHPMLSVRRAAGQLFAVVASYLHRPSSDPSQDLARPGSSSTGGTGTSSMPPATGGGDEALCLLSGLCRDVDQILSDSSGSTAPSIHTLLSPHSGPLNAALLMRQQGEAQGRRQQVQGLVEVACALFEEPQQPQQDDAAPPGSSSRGPALVTATPAPVPPSPWWLTSPVTASLVRVFSCSWGLPPPQVSLLRHSPVEPSTPPPPPFKFGADPAAAEAAMRQQELTALLMGHTQEEGQASLAPTVLQDHQTREHALDALLLLLRNPHGLPSLAHCAPLYTLVDPESSGTNIAGAVQLLHGLVMALLHKETPAHVRAAMAILGAIRWRPSCDSLPDEELPCISSPAAVGDKQGSKVNAGVTESDPGIAALAQLLGLLCDVFDCAWAAEALPSEQLHGGGSTLAEQGGLRAPAAFTWGGGGGPAVAAPPSAASGPVFGTPQTSLLGSSPKASGLSAAGSSPAPLLWGAAPAPKPLLQVEVGLGHRVLVQVLQAWRRLSESGGSGVAAALDRTQWWSRIMLAHSHNRR